MQTIGDAHIGRDGAVRSRALRTGLVLLVLIGSSACAPEPVDPELRRSVLSSVGEVLHPSTLYVRFDEPEHQLVVFDKLGGRELGRIPDTAGAKLALTHEARPCELESRGSTTDVETVANEKGPGSTTANPGHHTRTTKSAHVTLRCADGPAPGVVSAPSIPGWRAFNGLLPFVWLGLFIGALYWRGDDQNQLGLQLGAMALGLVTLAAAFVLAWRTQTGALVLTLPLLAAVNGALGWFAALLWLGNDDTRSRVGAAGFIIAALTGPALLALYYPLWSGVAPLAALGIVLGAAVAAGTIAVSGK